jgi:Methyltransferase domain
VTGEGGSGLAIRRVRVELGRRSRPIRRVVTPRRFKETYVNEALRRRREPAYLEIGVRDGESFRAARAARKIGIDPDRRPAMRRLRAGEEFYEMTSDRFFAEAARYVLADSPVDVALVDGLHEFRQALRDLLGLERYLRPDGVVVLDDCNPRSAERAGEVGDGGAWNGDVWKVAAYVRRERPDLSFVTVDANQGVGVVTGFGAAPGPPPAGTVAAYKALPYEHLLRDRRETLGLVDPGPLSRVLADRGPP